MLVVSNSSLTKVGKNWKTCIDRHWSRVVYMAIGQDFSGNGSPYFIFFNLREDGTILDSLEDVIGRDIWDYLSVA